MAKQEHVDLLKQGVANWNKWREKHPDFSPNLSDADLSGVDLHRANLSKTNLRRANLRRANLFGADLFEANLTFAKLNGANLIKVDLILAKLSGADLGSADLGGADLLGANLFEANLVRADLFEANLVSTELSGADLGSADLRRANLVSTELSGANLGKALFGNTSLSDVDLSDVQGLEAANHEEKSYVDIHTLYRSRGKIPEVFLRGIGAPDTLIEYVRSLTIVPVQYYSCFISYSSKDEAFAKRLHADLQDKGVRCWFAPKDLKVGDKFPVRIVEAIRQHDKLLVVISKRSIASGWVETEVQAALERELLEKKMVLFPIRLDRAVLDSPLDWATRIRRERHIGDFARRGTDAYERSLERLLRDLKAEPNIPGLGQDDSKGGKGK